VSGTFLAQMAAASRARVRSARERCPDGELEQRARRAPAPPPLRLDRSGFDLIAELKLRSPAAGALVAAGADGADAAGEVQIVRRVRDYAQGGAAAVSVLTEASRFDGALEHLAAAAAALAPLALPAMRKDFIVDPYQVLEARALGAGGVLVIVRMLARAELDALLECAAAHGLFVLLEAFDAADIALMRELIAAHRGPNLLLAGVNCRDLTTLQVVPRRLLELAPLLPEAVPRVAESGVASAADAAQVATAGYELALVGSALMQGSDSTALAAALLAAGRSARASGHGARGAR
jgi:indole-3-glycerol phosphate synthase